MTTQRVYEPAWHDRPIIEHKGKRYVELTMAELHLARRGRLANFVEFIDGSPHWQVFDRGSWTVPFGVGP